MRLFAAALCVMSLGTAGDAVIGGSELCGVTITQDLRLDADVVCTGDGIVAGADGIRIDLNGYTIQGSGIGTGVIVTGRKDVTVEGGVVRGFVAGVRLNSATGVVIHDMELVANNDGIDAQAGAIGNAIKDNVFRENTVRAVMLRSNSVDNDVKGNTFTANRIGVLVFGGVDSRIKDNTFAGSTLTAIRVNAPSTGNAIKDNRFDGNAAGVEFTVLPAGSATGNELKDNTLAGNACAVKGPTEGNTLKDNRFENNVADSCS